MKSVNLLDRLTGKRASDLLASPLGIVSPWAAAGNLAPMVVAETLGLDPNALPLTREQAIMIPAVSKARNLLVSTIAKFPLVALDKAGPIENQPAFLYRSNDIVSPYERMAWTVDDLIFHGYSLWQVKRGARDEGGRAPILSASYVPQWRWSITEGYILLDDGPVDEQDVILFNSPFEGLLNIANRTMKGARDQEQAWTGRARNPIPVIELHQLDDQIDDSEAKEFVHAWAVARKSENGAIGYTPPSLEIRTHGEVHADLMVEGRNAVRTDIGSFLNIRASMLDGTMGIDSLTYSTTEGERNSFYEFDLPFWTDPIQHRLSLDDVVPRGQRVRFDMYEAYNPPTRTGITEED